jgi:LemA protein
MTFGYKVKPNFAVDNEAEISKPPTVQFAPPATTATTPPSKTPPGSKPDVTSAASPPWNPTK